MEDQQDCPQLAFVLDQVASWFGIPADTLLEWQRMGKINQAQLAPNGEYIFSWRDVKLIAEHVRSQIRIDIERQVLEKPDEVCPSIDLLERIYRTEIFGSDEIEHGLDQLEGFARRNGLSTGICKVLLDEASQRPRADSLRTQILELLLADAETQPCR